MDFASFDLAEDFPQAEPRFLGPMLRKRHSSPTDVTADFGVESCPRHSDRFAHEPDICNAFALHKTVVTSGLILYHRGGFVVRIRLVFG